MAGPPQYQAQEPFLIYQDNFFSQATSMISHAPMPPASKPARQPLQRANSNVVLNPPTATSTKQSPYKSNARPSEAPLAPANASQGNKLNNNAVQIAPPNSLGPSTDSLKKKPPLMSRFKTVAQKPQPELNMQCVGKSVSHPPIYPAPSQSQLNLPLENYHQKPSGKRLLEAAPIKDLRPTKQPRLDEPLPPPDSFPPIEDDGKKPAHSYATLIAMAILRSPQRRLTLSQIYRWISSTYSFYKPNDAGWQNSIRHNLSLNKNFTKIVRSKDDPGKGCYWAIEPGAEHLFMKEKPSRKSAASAENIPVMSTRLEPSQPLSQPHQPQVPFIHEPMLPPQLAAPASSLPQLPPASQQLAPAPPLPELSSDATIPASDIATVDDGLERPAENEVPNEPELYSPLPASMHSSPPIPRHIDARHSGTPPSQPRLHPSPATKSRSQRMDDSGYISSLESSVMRPNHAAKLLTSEADRPRIKRGRAEEEIARLRASSYDSPSKGRSYGYPPPSSSPIRQTIQNAPGQMLPPLTPAMKPKAPPKPPPSVSPGTNLRLHRENIQSLVESPIRRVSALLPETEVALQQTPGFDFDDQLFYDLERKPDDNQGFNIFEDQSPFPSVFALTPAIASTGSPTKRSARKQRLERSQSTSVLNDTTASSNNTSSFLKLPNQPSNLLLDTPSKVFDGLLSSPSKLFLDLQSPTKIPVANNENLEPWPCFNGLDAADFLEDNDFSGFDMLAGFQKIGSSNSQTTSRAAKPAPNASLCRSSTTTF